jgi:hypothetical protein
VQRLDVAEVGSEFGLSLICSGLADSMGAINNKSTIMNQIVISIRALKTVLFFVYLLCHHPWQGTES